MNEFNPDFNLIFHFNASKNPNSSGVMGLYKNTGTQKQDNAAITAAIAKITGMKDLGAVIETKSQHTSGLALTHGFNARSAYIEGGFMTNTFDAQFIKNPQQLALGTAEGLVQLLTGNTIDINNMPSQVSGQVTTSAPAASFNFANLMQSYVAQNYVQASGQLDPNVLNQIAVRSAANIMHMTDEEKEEYEKQQEEISKEEKEKIEEYHSEGKSRQGIKYNESDIQQLQKEHPNWTKKEIYNELDSRPEYGLSNLKYLQYMGIKVPNYRPGIVNQIADRLRNGYGPNGTKFAQEDISKMMATGLSKDAAKAALSKTQKYAFDNERTAFTDYKISRNGGNSWTNAITYSPGVTTSVMQNSEQALAELKAYDDKYKTHNAVDVNEAEENAKIYAAENQAFGKGQTVIPALEDNAAKKEKDAWEKQLKEYNKLYEQNAEEAEVMMKKKLDESQAIIDNLMKAVDEGKTSYQEAIKKMHQLVAEGKMAPVDYQSLVDHAKNHDTKVRVIIDQAKLKGSFKISDEVAKVSDINQIIEVLQQILENQDNQNKAVPDKGGTPQQEKGQKRDPNPSDGDNNGGQPQESGK